MQFLHLLLVTFLFHDHPLGIPSLEWIEDVSIGKRVELLGIGVRARGCMLTRPEKIHMGRNVLRRAHLGM
jgi:hypothetical protein